MLFCLSIFAWVSFFLLIFLQGSFWLLIFCGVSFCKVLQWFVAFYFVSIGWLLFCQKCLCSVPFCKVFFCFALYNVITLNACHSALSLSICVIFQSASLLGVILMSVVLLNVAAPSKAVAQNSWWLLPLLSSVHFSS